jgi:putative endonuclease
VTLVWAEEHPSVRECYRVEKQIQGWGRRKREALISGGWTSLTGLGSRASAARDRRA